VGDDRQRARVQQVLATFREAKGGPSCASCVACSVLDIQHLAPWWCAVGGRYFSLTVFVPCEWVCAFYVYGQRLDQALADMGGEPPA